MRSARDRSRSLTPAVSCGCSWPWRSSVLRSSTSPSCRNTSRSGWPRRWFFVALASPRPSRRSSCCCGPRPLEPPAPRRRDLGRTTVVWAWSRAWGLPSGPTPSSLSPSGSPTSLPSPSSCGPSSSSSCCAASRSAPSAASGPSTWPTRGGRRAGRHRGRSGVESGGVVLRRSFGEPHELGHGLADERRRVREVSRLLTPNLRSDLPARGGARRPSPRPTMEESREGLT